MKVIRVPACFLSIVTDIRVQPHGFGVIPAGKFTQNFVPHTVAAITIDIGDINIHADTRIRFAHFHDCSHETVSRKAKSLAVNVINFRTAFTRYRETFVRLPRKYLAESFGAQATN
jgi:hypothetical protein